LQKGRPHMPDRRNLSHKTKSPAHVGEPREGESVWSEYWAAATLQENAVAAVRLTIHQVPISMQIFTERVLLYPENEKLV
jgi:hypothetical protein